MSYSPDWLGIRVLGVRSVYDVGAGDGVGDGDDDELELGGHVFIQCGCPSRLWLWLPRLKGFRSAGHLSYQSVSAVRVAVKLIICMPRNLISDGWRSSLLDPAITAIHIRARVSPTIRSSFSRASSSSSDVNFKLPRTSPYPIDSTACSLSRGGGGGRSRQVFS